MQAEKYLILTQIQLKWNAKWYDHVLDVYFCLTCRLAL